jgi:ActR/RegA family two-component response regulator
MTIHASLGIVNEPQSLTEGDPSLAARCVRALMDRHGLPRYRQSPWLADALGLSYSQAHRRMSGAAPWTLEELDRVGALFGESLAEVVVLDRPPSVPAIMRMGAAAVDCQLRLGDVVEHPHPNSLVAVRTSSGWIALCASEATEGVTYRIEQLEARPSDTVRSVIAVLDDDKDLTNSICAHFDASGYEARPFYKTADLLSSAKKQKYDGFVIDWIVGESSTLKLIADLRDHDAGCPIVVLTAQVLSGIVDEADIAEAVKKFDLVFSEKPVRMSILSATLSRAFNTRV